MLSRVPRDAGIVFLGPLIVEEAWEMAVPPDVFRVF